MLVVKFPDKAILVTFAHPTEGKRGKRATICKLLQLTDPTTEPKLLAKGHTACSKQDAFNKARGRKIALQRALCQHDKLGSFVSKIFGFTGTEVKCRKCGAEFSPPVKLTKEQRRQVWESYFSKIRPVQKEKE